MHGPRVLLFPGLTAMALALLYQFRADTPITGSAYFLAWIWIALVTAFTRSVFDSQARRIKALEERLSQLEGQ